LAGILAHTIRQPGLARESGIHDEKIFKNRPKIWTKNQFYPRHRLLGFERMKSFDPRRFRGLFYAAAAWNFSAAAVALAAPEFHAQMFFGSADSLEAAGGSINHQIVWISIAFFGLGYLLVARDPRKNHALVLIAAMGKASVGILWVDGYLNHAVSALVLAGAVGDLIFAGLFANFLIRARTLEVSPGDTNP
jgi:hypothetical protein